MCRGFRVSVEAGVYSAWSIGPLDPLGVDGSEAARRAS